jgi:hypothetical protein
MGTGLAAFKALNPPGLTTAVSRDITLFDAEMSITPPATATHCDVQLRPGAVEDDVAARVAAGRQVRQPFRRAARRQVDVQIVPLERETER